jgi:hypothetical protein
LPLVGILIASSKHEAGEVMSWCFKISSQSSSKEG